VYFVTYPASNAHAPYYIVICGLSGLARFFWGGGLLLIKLVFLFSLQLVLNISHYKKNEEKNYQKVCLGISVNYPLFLSDFKQT
jgi:hypothetical protein